jgi:glyoxylase-like metal-dependent hydrolase (beta-lactamase superfamily II)
VQVEPDGGEADWTRAGVYEVDPGVYRIPLPLPTDGLRAVNVYALVSPGTDGLVMIDSGWAITEARTALETALDALGHGVADVRRFLVTHVHRDHYAMAVAVRREFGNQVSLGAGEEPTISSLTDPTRKPLMASVGQLRRAGANDLVAWLLERADKLDHDPAAWSPPDDWLDDDTTVTAGQRTLDVVATPGHTRGHVVFRDPAAGLMFAGDHVLPHITPSIGFEPVPVEQPLGDYLGSLRRVRGLPDLRLLPAHGPVAASVHARVDELLTHHERRLDAAVVAVGAGGTAFEAAQRLTWTRRERKLADLDPFNQMLAIGETAAHLDLLVAQGRLRMTDVDGVWHYQQS